MSKHSIYIANNEKLSKLAPESIHLTVTSPPYVTTEFKKGQEFDYEGFLKEFRETASNIHRVTVAGGRFALNVADIITKYRYDDDDRISRVPLGSDLLQICQDCGFRLFERFIWDKGFTRNFGGPLLGSYPYPMSIFSNNYFEYVYVFKKTGNRKVKQPVREMSRISLEEWRIWSQQWWRIESISERCNYHRAIFPVEIPYRLIRMYSYAGDTVLDPYSGTGTTMLAASKCNRNSIGFEIDPDCKLWMVERMKSELAQGAISSEVQYTISEEVS
jgi:site-specific DNA-methyltransferase (adenine-specific)